MKKVKVRTCGECYHEYACSAHTCANMHNTDASHCVNFETLTEILARYAAIFGYEKRDKR